MVYALSDALAFPPPERASPGGLLAVGGDVSPERLLLAYSQGIFPWPSPNTPLLWFSPDPRFVLEPRCARVSRSLRKTVRRGRYEIRTDTRFEDVIRACSGVARPGQAGTWITDELVAGYTRLHELGYAHSVEAFEDGELVGGLYGVGLGKVFAGESMFALRPDASKVAFVALLGELIGRGVELVDCQVHTDHLARFGAEEWPRSVFLRRLRESIAHPTAPGRWERAMCPEEAISRLDRLDSDGHGR